MLLRPIAIGASVVMMAYVWFCVHPRLGLRRSMAAACLVFVGMLGIAARWELWVYKRTGRFPAERRGALSMRDRLTYATRLKEFRIPMRVPRDVEVVNLVPGAVVATTEAVTRSVTRPKFWEAA